MTSPTKFYYVTQAIFLIRSCSKSLVTLVFLWEKLSRLQFYKDLTRNIEFLLGWSWFKFQNLRLVLGMASKFYSSVKKVRMFWELTLTFGDVTGEKLVGVVPTPSPIGLISNYKLWKAVSAVDLQCTQKLKVSIKDFFSKCHEIRRKRFLNGKFHCLYCEI